MDSLLLIFRMQVKPKALESLSVDASAFPPGSSERTHVKVGTMDRKNAKYDVWSIAEHSDTRNASSPEYDIESEESLIGGQEILGLQCLLPRRSNGKLQLGVSYSNPPSEPYSQRS